MSDHSAADTEFLKHLHEAIAQNMANEYFGVAELAESMSMSRSNLLRKVKKLTNVPVNQLIREARLKRAMELLQNSGSTFLKSLTRLGSTFPPILLNAFANIMATLRVKPVSEVYRNQLPEEKIR